MSVENAQNQPLFPGTMSQEMKRGLFYASVALIVLCFVSYWPTHSARFIDQYDDLQYIIENEHVRQGLTLKGMRWALTSNYAANWHPLTWMSHMVDVSLFGMNAGGHHLTNIILHSINSILVMFVLFLPTRAFWRSALVAALFAVHPLHVESVAWVSERKDVLSTLLGLIAILGYYRYARSASVRTYLPVALLFALSLTAKPMLVTLPILLLVLDYWPLGRLGSPLLSAGKNRAVLWEKIPLLTLSGLASVATVWAQQSWGAVASLTSIPIHIRLLNAGRSKLLYLYKTFVPRNLAVFYPYPPEYPVVAASVASVFIFGFTVVVFRHPRVPKWVRMGWAWWLISLVPVIGLVQVGFQTHADRYMYIPSVGILVIIAWSIASATDRFKKAGGFLKSAVCVWIGLLCILSFRQAKVWKDSATLFRHATEVTPANYMAHNTYGVILLERGHTEEALRHFTRAYEFRKLPVRADLNIGIALERLGRFDEAERNYMRILRYQPNSWKAYNNLGMLFLKQDEPQNAAACFANALECGGMTSWEVHNNRGIALRRIDSTRQAYSAFTKAIALAPTYTAPVLNRGSLSAGLGNYKEGRSDFLKAIEIDPHCIYAYMKLGEIEKKVSNFQRARDWYNRILAIDSSNTSAKEALCSLP